MDFINNLDLNKLMELIWVKNRTLIHTQSLAIVNLKGGKIHPSFNHIHIPILLSNRAYF